jgi:hypothetical protein
MFEGLSKLVSCVESLEGLLKILSDKEVSAKVSERCKSSKKVIRVVWKRL